MHISKLSSLFLIQLVIFRTYEIKLWPQICGWSNSGMITKCDGIPTNTAVSTCSTYPPTTSGGQTSSSITSKFLAFLKKIRPLGQLFVKIWYFGQFFAFWVGVDMLHVPSDHIWRPDIVLYNKWVFGISQKNKGHFVNFLTKSGILGNFFTFWLVLTCSTHPRPPLEARYCPL